MINEQPRQIEHAGHPGDHRDHMQRLDPFVHRGLSHSFPMRCFVKRIAATDRPVSALPSALGEVFRKLAQQKESRIEEGHLMPDHVHMMISIPPKYAVSQVVGFIKGKSAIHLARVYGEKKRNFVGQHFWARGYFVSTVGRDEAVIREYIRNQEQEDSRLEQMNLWR